MTVASLKRSIRHITHPVYLTRSRYGWRLQQSSSQLLVSFSFRLFVLNAIGSDKLFDPGRYQKYLLQG